MTNEEMFEKYGDDVHPRRAFECSKCGVRLAHDIKLMSIQVDQCEKSHIGNVWKCGLTDLLEFVMRLDNKAVGKPKVLPRILQPATSWADQVKLAEQRKQPPEVVEESQDFEFTVDDPIRILISKKGHVTIIDSGNQ